MSTDDARASFNMFTWVRETIWANKKSIRDTSGADGVLLTGFLYRLLFLFAMFTLFVSVPLGGMYATYDWTTEVKPLEVPLNKDYSFDEIHWGDANLVDWLAKAPIVEKNHHWNKNHHDHRVAEVDELADHVTETVMWVQLLETTEVDGEKQESKLPPQKVPTVQDMIDLCGPKDSKKCAGATLGLSATKGVKFNQCPDRLLTEEERSRCDNWFEVRAIPKDVKVDFSEADLQALQRNTKLFFADPDLVSNKKPYDGEYPYLRPDDPTDDDKEDDPDAVYLMEKKETAKKQEAEELKKDKFKTRLMAVTGHDVKNMNHVLDELIPLAIEKADKKKKKKKIHLRLNRPTSENVVRIKKGASEQLTGEGHNFVGWTVNWMSLKPLDDPDHEPIYFLDADEIAKIDIIEKHWEEVVYFHVEKYKPGWIDYISLVHVPFDSTIRGIYLVELASTSRSRSSGC